MLSQLLKTVGLRMPPLETTRGNLEVISW